MIIFLLVVALVMLFQNPGQRTRQDITFRHFLDEVERGHVRQVTISGDEIKIIGYFTDNRAFSTYAPNDPIVLETLDKNNVPVLKNVPIAKKVLISAKPRQ